jgi:hypothetical protein
MTPAQSGNVRPLVVMLIVGGLVIAGIVLMMMLSKSGETSLTEQVEDDSPAGNSSTPFSSTQSDSSLTDNSPALPGVSGGDRLVPSSFFVPARRYYSMKFNISTQSGLRVVGDFWASGGSGNDIEVMIVDEEGFKNFANKQGVRTYYNSGKLSIGNIDVRLKPGTYYIIFNNNFSLISNKTVIAEIALKG